jgi:hypothetical protein
MLVYIRLRCLFKYSEGTGNFIRAFFQRLVKTGTQDIPAAATIRVD